MSVPSPSVGQIFGHYRLIEQIGAGGMGVVFRAFDEQLRRDVAVKILPHQLFSNETSRAQFRREALTVGKLNHPNLAMAFDFGEQDGVDYLVTEYIPGLNLDEKIGHQPMPQKQALELGIQLASGLEAAHREKVIHRDLKPGNIRINPDGQLKILDFGLAQTLEPLAEETETAVLEAGPAMSGTLPYMAPELLRSEAGDARSDIWAAGAVLYEMASGKRAYPDRQPSLLIDAILHYDPVRPTLINPKITAPFEAVILKALDREPERRYQSARELRVDLARLLSGGELTTDTLRRSGVIEVEATARRRKVAIALAAVLAIGIVTGVLVKRWWPKPPVQQRILAVLPIETVGQDQATGALGMGLMDTLTAKLQQASDTDSVQVVSSQDLRDQKVKTAEDARREFGTDFVLESSMQRSGRTIRINAYLVDSKTHRQIAARTVETDGSDPFQLQDEVVNAALDMLPVQIHSAQRKELAARQDTKPAAYEAYIRGRGYLQEYEKPENIDNAIAEFNEAVEIDPNYAPAYAGLGEAYLTGYYRWDKGTDWASKASRNCEKALSLSPNSVQAYICIGNVLNGTGKYAEAADVFKQAVASNAQNEDALLGLANAYAKLGNYAAAESAYKKAVTLRPNYWAVYHSLGLFYYEQSRYSEAADFFLREIKLAPDNYQGYYTLGGIYVTEGRYQDAIDAFQRSIDLRPSSDAYNNLGYAYTLLHRYPEAISALQQALNLNDADWMIWGNLADALYWSGKQTIARTRYLKAVSLATAKLEVNPQDSEILAYVADYWAMLDNQQQALDYLHKALTVDPANAGVLFRAAIISQHFNKTDETLSYLKKAIAGNYSLAIIKDTPDFQSLQQDPRFRALLQKAGA